MTNRLTAAESRDLTESVRSACERLAGEAQIREIAYHGDGFDRNLWRVLCSQIGVGAIALPEDLGGAGYGDTALGLVAHELGRVLAPVPFLTSAVLATGILLDVGAGDIAAELADGKRTATAVLTEDGGQWRHRNAPFLATPRGTEWNLSGSARHVLHGKGADVIVAAALVDGQPALFLLDGESDGVTITTEDVLDPTRPLATMTLVDAAARRIDADGSTETVIGHNLGRALAALSAEQVGAHERVLEIATAYAQTREQFGRPIGSFQSIKHRCADMLVNLEWSRSASLAALNATEGSTDDAPWLTSLAKAVCSEGLRDAAHANLQIHGGIGYTWEDSAHLYLKRARTDEVLFGGNDTHWDQVATEAKLF